MGLHDKHIVIDGFNLGLDQGTGIKTYGVALLRAVRSLGARVSVLWEARRSRVPLVQEALLNDGTKKGPSRLSLLWGGLCPLLGLARRATGVGPSDWILPADPDESLAPWLHRSYFVPGCFGAANNLFRLTGVASGVRFRDRVDLFHSTYPLPVRVRRAPNLTTIHDLIPLKLPWATLDNKQFFYRLVRKTLATSDLVVTISESARADILEAFRARPERVAVVSPGVPEARRFTPDLLARCLRVYGLQKQNYLLFVGAIQPRKNLGRLCQALLHLDCDVPLVVVGAKGWLWEQELRYAHGLRAKNRILFLDHVPRHHLQALYTGALLFAFPSVYEGFGLPPLEAMAHGCPVLAANTSSLPEVCGDAAVYCDPYRVDDIAEKIQTLLHDPGLRAALVRKGAARVERYSLESYRQRLLETYSRVLP